MPELHFADATANDADVPFAYDLALAAARDLWTLAREVRMSGSERQADRLDAIDR